MPLAVLEPGKEMAIANFSLAIFCLFTVALPLLLITRGDKSKANRNFLAATINPWSQVDRETDLANVVLSEITSSIKLENHQEGALEENAGTIQETSEVISIEVTRDDKSEESSNQTLSTDEELLVA